MYTRIVVPLDGSTIAELALPHAVEFAQMSGATLHLVRIVDLTQLDRFGEHALALDGHAIVDVLQKERALASAYLEQTAERLAKKQIEVTTELCQESAARGIVGIVRAGDLVVMTTHGSSGSKPWFLGSVAEEIVRHSPAPVLLLRA